MSNQAPHHDLRPRARARQEAAAADAAAPPAREQVMGLGDAPGTPLRPGQGEETLSPAQLTNLVTLWC